MKGERLNRYRVTFQGTVERFADVIAINQEVAEQVAYDNWHEEFIELGDPEWELESIRPTEVDPDVPTYVMRNCMRRE